MGGEGVTQLASAIEKSGKAGDLVVARSSFDELVSEFERLKQAIEVSSLFGGTMQSSLSGSSVVEKNLDRLTLFVASIWAISIVGVGLLLKVGA